MSIALAAALAIYMKVGLRIGWGPGKTKLILPPQCDPDAFMQQLDSSGEGLPHIVPGFNTCLSAPRHANNDPKSITTTLESLGIRHDRLLDFVEDV